MLKTTRSAYGTLSPTSSAQSLRTIGFAHWHSVPDGRTFASGSADGTILIWDFATVEAMYNLANPV